MRSRTHTRERRNRSERGQAATEYLLVIAVVIIAVVGSAYSFAPSLRTGVNELSTDVHTALDTGALRDVPSAHPNGDDAEAKTPPAPPPDLAVGAGNGPVNAVTGNDNIYSFTIP